MVELEGFTVDEEFEAHTGPRGPMSSGGNGREEDGMERGLYRAHSAVFLCVRLAI
ncbi:MAG: hypothetical protein LBB24_01995 [Rickettsiales bacterium]|nr:hypothetical protein [Rickettsiales bacterium]